MARSTLIVNRKSVHYRSDHSRVITRLFLPGGKDRVRKVIDRVAALPDPEVRSLLQETCELFGGRHRNIDELLMQNVREAVGEHDAISALSGDKKMLLGSYFTMEYAVESAALFNPSIVPAPEQAGLPPGYVRVIISFRATGEGHVSSLEFREGIITDENDLVLEPITPYLDRPQIAKNVCYDKDLFRLRLLEMSVPEEASEDALKPLYQSNEIIDSLLTRLDHCFSLESLGLAMSVLRAEQRFDPEAIQETFRRIMWLAASNYEIRFDPETTISQRIIFPLSDNERRGIEDARFVRFVDGDDVRYYATYSAFDGDRVRTQLLETKDFLSFQVSTLNGKHANSKGMALFPRKLDGKYAMVSRVDGENLFLMYSHDVGFWHEAELLQEPREPWEFVQIGNCGSPIETEKGWLLLTHGVGPMRRYCIGATLFDLDDPSRILGRLREPFISPTETEREGYVPNVVYTCGSLVHNNKLIVPYAMSDTATSLATVSLPALLDALLAGS